jgi:serine protease Do
MPDTQTCNKQMQSEQRSFLQKRKTALLAGVFGLGAISALAFQPVIEATAPRATAAEAQVPQNVQPPFSFADVVQGVSPAVVSVRTKTQSRTPAMAGIEGIPEGHPLERFFERFGPQFGMPGQRPGRPQGRMMMGQGSGFFISEDGYVVTNNHVVENANEVLVALPDGTEYEAEVIGTDDKTDLALLKVNQNDDFTYVRFAEERPRIGDWVVAVGNPFGLGGTVTAGIVSAQGREIGAGPYDDFIQIDAAVNRGNSGGPSFNYRGEVVGVNTAIFSPSGGNVGIAFAIPAETVQAVIADLRDDGQVTRGWLGVQIQPVTQDIAEGLGRSEEGGALVVEAQSGSPAADAGLRSGDAIIKVDGSAIQSPRDLARTIAGYAPGTQVAVTVWRDGEEQVIPVDLGRLPGEQQRADAGPARSTDGGDRLSGLGLVLAPAARAGLDGNGVVVMDIEAGSPAAERGLREGDIIRELGGETVRSVRDIAKGLEKAGRDGRNSALARVENDQGSRFVALPALRG